MVVCADDFCISYFCISHKLYALVISASADVDDFWVGSDSIFVTDSCVRRKPYAMISTLAVKLCCVDYF